MSASDVTFAGLIVRGLAGLLIPTFLSGVGYFGIKFVARRIGRTSWAIYLVRLGIMIVFAAAWWYSYAEFIFRANSGNALLADTWYRSAFHEGVGFGMHSVWAWFAVALIDRPRIRTDSTVTG